MIAALPRKHTPRYPRRYTSKRMSFSSYAGLAPSRRRIGSPTAPGTRRIRKKGGWIYRLVPSHAVRRRIALVLGPCDSLPNVGRPVGGETSKKPLAGNYFWRSCLTPNRDRQEADSRAIIPRVKPDITHEREYTPQPQPATR